MKRLFKVTGTVTKVYSFPIEANSPEEAEAICEQYLVDGEEGTEEFQEIGDFEAVPAEEGGDGDLIVVDARQERIGEEYSIEAH